jgi:hypothetical protein
LTPPSSTIDSGSVAGMQLKALCILSVIFVSIGMVGIAIRRKRGL